MANPLEKIQALDAIEKEIILCIQSAGNALQELSKEKPSQKNAEVNKLINFNKTIILSIPSFSESHQPIPKISEQHRKQVNGADQLPPSGFNNFGARR